MKRITSHSNLLLGSAHFFVDFACTAMLTLAAKELSFWWVTACAVLYNGLAFAFQLPIGALGDCLKLHRGLAALGCLLVAAGALFSQPIAMCVAIGLGNACFHVGGGREALKRGKGAAAHAGRFVAPGAIGIFLGPRLAELAWLTKIALPLCLLLLAGMLLATRKEGSQAEELYLEPAPMNRGRLAVICCCMFLTVLLRSYMGTILRYPFLSDVGAALCYTLCIFGGKYFGGILADRLGTMGFCLAAQIAGTVLFALSAAVPGMAFPAIFLFNTTMAVTAAGLYRCAPRFPGTMFGLTTFALYLGVLPRLLGAENLLFSWWGLGLLSLFSGVLLVTGLMLMKGGGHGGGADRDLAAEIPGTDAGS